MNNGLLLGLDSCGAETTLALAELAGGQLRIVREHALRARTAEARILPALAEVLGGARLDGIVTVRGPGSFTGMRIGLSAAKALAEAWGVPLCGVSRLAVLSTLGGNGRPVVLHAGRGSIYLSEQGVERLCSVQTLSADQITGVAACEEKLLPLFPQAQLLSEPTAADALRFALSRILADDWDDAALFDAQYLWESDRMLRFPAS